MGGPTGTAAARLVVTRSFCCWPVSSSSISPCTTTSCEVLISRLQTMHWDCMQAHQACNSRKLHGASKEKQAPFCRRLSSLAGCGVKPGTHCRLLPMLRKGHGSGVDLLAHVTGPVVSGTPARLVSQHLHHLPACAAALLESLHLGVCTEQGSGVSPLSKGSCKG